MMMFRRNIFLLFLATLSFAPTKGFTIPKPCSRSHASSFTTLSSSNNNKRNSKTLLSAIDTDTKQDVPLPTEKTDVDVERLRAMAAKYRAEAAALEAERSRESAAAAERAFAKFDRDEDGQISLAELKAGLETQLKTELPPDRVEILMQRFDASGDGKLQMEEFVGVERFKTALAELAREEKRRALELQATAKQEEEAYNKIAEILNDKPPSNVEKVLSVIPYVFPLLDTLPYASFLVLDNPDNPVTQLIAGAYFVYRSIPLSGFIAALSLTFLSGIPRINRLIRFNMLQAIYLDIALFVPGIISLLVAGTSQLTGQQVPVDVVAAASNVLFFASLSAILYASVSSLAGREPDNIPFVSDRVKGLLPTVELLKEIINEENQKNDRSDKKDQE